MRSGVECLTSPLTAIRGLRFGYVEQIVRGQFLNVNQTGDCISFYRPFEVWLCVINQHHELAGGR